MRKTLAFYFILSIFWSFYGGMWLQKYWYGEARVFTNVDIPGDPLNHGQKSISVTFPHGIKAAHLKLPYGTIYPDDSKPRWVEVLPDGQEKVWLDSLSFEYEPYKTELP